MYIISILGAANCPSIAWATEAERAVDGMMATSPGRSGIGGVGDWARIRRCVLWTFIIVYYATKAAAAYITTQ